MKRSLLALALAFVCVSPALAQTGEKLSFGRFGTITLYRTSPRPAHVVLFVSGDGGWNLGVVDMARELAAQDTLVVGVDIRTYLQSLATSSEKCSYPAADFEALSKFVQKKLEYTRYVPPVLVGYSSGATLVYATLVQAPPPTFRGAMSLGFCPDLLLTKPMCRGSGLEANPGPKGKGYTFRPATALEVPWVAFQGTIDQVCNPLATEAYVKQVKNGDIVVLPKVGHGFSVPRNWLPQFKQSFAKLVAPRPEDAPVRPAEVSDLPLEEVPAEKPGGDLLVVHITGDGGWGVTDRGLARMLAAEGIPVVGLNSLQYFWSQKTPEQTAADLGRIMRHYLAAWNKQRVILIGYSFGADVLPFLVNHLPKELQARVQLITLLGPSHYADFEFHLTDWLGATRRSTSLAVLPEIEKLRGMRILCFYGEDEEDTLGPELASSGLATVVKLEGGHRVGRNFEPIAREILEAVR